MDKSEALKTLKDTRDKWTPVWRLACPRTYIEHSRLDSGGKPLPGSEADFLRAQEWRKACTEIINVLEKLEEVHAYFDDLATRVA